MLSSPESSSTLEYVSSVMIVLLTDKTSWKTSCDKCTWSNESSVPKELNNNDLYYLSLFSEGNYLYGSKWIGFQGPYSLLGDRRF